ncbi:hypothetical protein JHK85_053384 [Glycine max]|nr:hypothetical protein JHK85_053384 [Glycine max]
MDRFGHIAVQIQNLNPEVALHSMLLNLHPNKFTESLCKNTLVVWTSCANEPRDTSRWKKCPDSGTKELAKPHPTAVEGTQVMNKGLPIRAFIVYQTSLDDEFDIDLWENTSDRGQKPIEELVKLHSLYIDGSSNVKGSRAGIILKGPNNITLEQALKLNFKVSNNRSSTRRSL